MTDIKEIDPIEANELIQAGAMFIDVREQGELEEHAFIVPQLQNIPYSVFDERYLEIPKDQQIILACHSGARSRRVAEFLVIQGWSAEDLYNLEGGIIAWTLKKMPTKKGKRSFTMVKETSSCGCGTESSDSCC